MDVFNGDADALKAWAGVTDEQKPPDPDPLPNPLSLEGLDLRVKILERTLADMQAGK
jgi:hypothetical protein